MMKKVMIVDDDEDIVRCQQVIVKALGHKPLVARDGKEFLDSLKSARPDLVLLDVMMAGPDTKEILERSRRLCTWDMKIILVTVVKFSDEEIGLLKQKYGIVDYVRKPFDVEDIRTVIKKHLYSHEQGKIPDRCPIRKNISLVSQRWTFLVLLDLYKDLPSVKRYSQLRKNLSPITSPMLSTRLAELERAGLILRAAHTSGTSLRCEYSLTRSGEDFTRVLDAFKEWGVKWKGGLKPCAGSCRVCPL